MSSSTARHVSIEHLAMLAQIKQLWRCLLLPEYSQTPEYIEAIRRTAQSDARFFIVEETDTNVYFFDESEDNLIL